MTHRLALAALVALAAPAVADDTLDAARVAMQRNDTAEALRILDRLIAKDKSDAVAYRMRAGVHSARKEPAKAVADLDQVIRLEPHLAEPYHMRGMEQFRLGRAAEAVADFDKFLEIAPSQKPHHWQRGIALYYAGRFKEGADQFELHKTVNPDDAENAAWHFACRAKEVGADKARAGLMKIGEDRRVPLMTIYALYAGKAAPQTLLTAAAAGDVSPARKKEQLFYAHLYLGLYHDATGDATAALDHMKKAAGEYGQPHYMGDVARVHVLLRSPKP